MSEHRPARNGGEHPRVPKGGSAADHETARRKKVTEENSALRKQAEAAGDSHSGEASDGLRESRLAGTGVASGSASDRDYGRSTTGAGSGATGTGTASGAAGTGVGSGGTSTGSGYGSSTGPRVTDPGSSGTYPGAGSERTSGRHASGDRLTGRDDDTSYGRLSGDGGRESYSGVDRDTEWRDSGETDIGVRHGIRADRGDGATPSVTTLLRTLAGDAGTLARKELALARSEITAAVSDVKTGIISTVSGGAVLYAGLLFLLLAATFGLATVMQGWLAALIVGAVVTIIGAILLMTGKKKMQADNFRPDRTVDSLRKDREMIDRRT
jgi:hypothetical protein